MERYEVVIRGQCSYAYAYSVEADTIEAAVEKAQYGEGNLVQTELDGHRAETVEVYDKDGKRILERTVEREHYV